MLKTRTDIWLQIWLKSKKKNIGHFTTRPEHVYIVVGIKIRCGLDGPGIDPFGRQIFGTDPDLLWGPSNLLYDAHRALNARSVAKTTPPHPAPRVKKE